MGPVPPSNGPDARPGAAPRAASNPRATPRSRCANMRPWRNESTGTTTARAEPPASARTPSWKAPGSPSVSGQRDEGALRRGRPRGLFDGARKVVAMKGKKITELDLGNEEDAAALASVALGPTGNLRPPLRRSARPGSWASTRRATARPSVIPNRASLPRQAAGPHAAASRPAFPRSRDPRRGARSETGSASRGPSRGPSAGLGGRAPNPPRRGSRVGGAGSINTGAPAAAPLSMPPTESDHPPAPEEEARRRPPAVSTPCASDPIPHGIDSWYPVLRGGEAPVLFADTGELRAVQRLARGWEELPAGGRVILQGSLRQRGRADLDDLAAALQRGGQRRALRGVPRSRGAATLLPAGDRAAFRGGAALLHRRGGVRPGSLAGLGILAPSDSRGGTAGRTSPSGPRAAAQPRATTSPSSRSRDPSL